MKTKSSFLFFLLLLLLTGCPNDPEDDDDDDLIDEVEHYYKINDIVHSPALEDNLLGDNPDRSVMVYLPPDYYEDTTVHFPVIYLLHGYYCSDETWYTGKFPTQEFAYIGMNIQNIMDELIKAGAVQSMMVVTPSAYNYFKGSWYTNSTVTGNWEDFIAEDVVKYVDDHYRTIPEPGGRGIAGHSMGGYGAMKLAMKHPDVFSSVYAHSAGRLDMETWLELDKDSILKAIDIQTWDPKSISPYLMVIISELSVFAPNPDSPPFFGDFPLTPSGEKVDAIWQKYMAHDPLTMIPLYENNLRQLRAIAFDNGSQEEDNVIRKNFSVALALQGIEHQFETFEGNHSNHTVEQMKLKIIPFFSENLDHAR